MLGKNEAIMQPKQAISLEDNTFLTLQCLIDTGIYNFELLSNIKEHITISTALSWAVEQNNPPALKSLIEAAESISDENFVRELGLAKTAALKVAAQNNNADAIVTLINAGANVTEALSWAAQENNLPALEALIEVAENRNDKDFAKELEHAKTAALTEAVHHGHEGGVQYLMDSGAKITDTLLWAARENNVPALEILIKAGADVNTTAGKNALNEAVRSDSAEAVEYLITQVERPANGHLIDIKSLLILAAKNNSCKAIGILDEYINDAANIVADSRSCDNKDGSMYSNFMKNIKCLVTLMKVISSAKSDALIIATYYGNNEAVQALIKAGTGIEATAKIDAENLGQIVSRILKSLPSGVGQSGSSVSTTEEAAHEQQAPSTKQPGNPSDIKCLQRLQKIQAEIGNVKNKKGLSKLIDCDFPYSREASLIKRFVRELVFRSDVSIDSKIEKLILGHKDRFNVRLFPKIGYDGKLCYADDLIKPALLSEVLSAPPSEAFDNKKRNAKFYHKLLAILKSWQIKDVLTGSWRVKDITKLEQHVKTLTPKEKKIRRFLEAFKLVAPRNSTVSGNGNVSTPITPLVIPSDNKVQSNPVGAKERTHSEQSGHSSDMNNQNSSNTQRTSKVRTAIKTNGSLVGRAGTVPTETRANSKSSGQRSGLASPTTSGHNSDMNNQNSGNTQHPSNRINMGTGGLLGNSGSTTISTTELSKCSKDLAPGSGHVNTPVSPTSSSGYGSGLPSPTIITLLLQPNGKGDHLTNYLSTNITRINTSQVRS